MRIENLPNWCIPDSSPAFYDTDSKSVLDQTAKLYGIIKKLVADYNEYAKELDKNMENFEEEVKKLQSEFEEKITKIIHDYIKTIDLKVAHQDRLIEESIVYIKENLTDGIIQVINDMKESGQLDEAIADSFNNLGERVTSIEAIVTSLGESTNALIERTNTNETNINSLDTRIKVVENKVLVNEYDSETKTLNILYKEVE